MIRQSLLVAVLSSFAMLVGCQPADDDDATGSDEGALGGTTNTHLAAVSRCTKAFTKAANAAMSTNDQIQANAGYETCLTRANVAAVRAIEGNLRTARSSRAGSAASSISAFELAGSRLCEELGKASPNFGGSLARVEGGACSAARARFLAQMIDGYVALGPESDSLPEDRSAHAGCYRAYDSRLAAGTQSTTEMVQALGALGACVGGRAAALAPAIADVEIGNDPGAGPASAASKRVGDVAAAAIDSGALLCGVLNEAGENGIGTLSRISSGDCSAKVAEHVYRALRAAID